LKNGITDRSAWATKKLPKHLFLKQMIASFSLARVLRVRPRGYREGQVLETQQMKTEESDFLGLPVDEHPHAGGNHNVHTETASFSLCCKSLGSC
jgi:hypothetical protein